MPSGQGKTQELLIASPGKKLIDCVEKLLPKGSSRRQVKRLIEQNGCQLNGVIVTHATTRLKKGDRVQVFPARLDELWKPVQQVEEDRILFEDEDLLVYDKPVGLMSEGGESGLIQLFREKDPNLCLGHRLDRLTSGVIILCKGKKATDYIHEQFRKREVNKLYLTIVDGVPREAEGRIEGFIGRLSQRGGQAFWGCVAAGKGGAARTEWEKLAAGKHAALLACRPKTGRTHQIRVHLESIGHPLLGDTHYVQRFKARYIPAHFLLHASTLTLKHPKTAAAMTWKAALPEEFRRVARLLDLELP